MKKRSLLLVFLFCIVAVLPVYGQVGIGTDTPNSESILDLSSTDKGFLPPRLDRTALTLNASHEGMIVYDVNDSGLYYWDGSAWQALSTATGSSPWNKSGSNVYLGDLTDFVGIGVSAPAYPLHMVSGSAKLGINGQVSGSNVQSNGLHLFTQTGTMNDPLGQSDNKGWGIVSIGNANPTSYLQSSIVYEYWDGSAWSPYFAFNKAGRLGIGTLDPQAALSIGTNSEYRVSASGNLERINNVPYSWQGSNTTGVLTNDGSGNLSWASGAGNFIQNQVAADQTAGFRIDGNGIFSSASSKLMLGVTSTIGTIGLSGEAQKLIYMDRNTVLDPGNSLVIQAGSAKSLANNATGGNLILRSGTSTGNAGSAIEFHTASPGGAGSSDNSPTPHMVLSPHGRLGIGTANPLKIIHLRQIADGTAIYLQSSSSLTALGSGMGEIVFGDNHTNVPQAAIRAVRDAAGGANDYPTALQFQTTADGTNTLATKMTIDNAGNVGIGDASPASMFTVGNGDLFQVNSSGNIVKINNITTNFPNAQGSANSFLQNDGSGNLTWAAPSGAFIQNQNAVLQSADFRISGSADANTYRIDGTTILKANGSTTISLGNGAGNSNNENTFVGYTAGQGMTSGNANAVFGAYAGLNGTGSYNTYIGVSTNYTGGNGNGNTLLGYEAGYTNFDGDNNTLLGRRAELLQNGLSNATAIGYNAKVNASNALVLGGTGAEQVSVGIGTTAPAAFLDIVGSGSGSYMGGYSSLMRLSTPDLNSYQIIFNNQSAGSAKDYGAYMDDGGNLIFVNDPTLTNNPESIFTLNQNGKAQIHKNAIFDQDLELSSTSNLIINGYAGSSGEILTIDGSGNMVWGSGAGGGSLDAAYDFGGAGAGRTITADAGAVRIMGGDGLVVSGAAGTGAAIGSVGNGSFMYFNPNKYAFRVGNTTSNLMDESLVGTGSFAAGQDNEASSDYSTAIGRYNEATAMYSTAIGYTNYATGQSSVVMGQDGLASGLRAVSLGYYNDASGDEAVAMSKYNVASGNSSFAVGNANNVSGASAAAIGKDNIVEGDYGLASGIGNHSRTYAETVIGSYANDYGGNPTSLIPADRLFVIGNGINASNRSDALTVTKNGHIGVNTQTDANYVLRVNRDASIPFGAGLANIYAFRDGSGTASEGGVDFSHNGLDAAIKGYSYWGNNFSAGVAGYSYLDFENSAGVIGANDGGTLYGALAYKDNSGNQWSIYGNANARIVGNIDLSASSKLIVNGDAGSSGDALSIDGSGNMVWATLSGESTTASNGLNLAGSNIKLGGSLTENTSIQLSSNNLNITGNDVLGVSIQNTDAPCAWGLGLVTPGFQTFTAISNEYVYSVELKFIDDLGGPTTVSIHPGTDNSLSAIATGTVIKGNPCLCTFSTPALLTSGNTYCISVSNPSAASTSCSDVYAGGGTGGSWNPGFDIHFKVTTGSPAPFVTMLGGANNYFGIGTNAPSELLSVGTSNQFQVNTSGDLVRIKNVPYTWPAADASGVLTSDGSGNLSWNSGSGNFIQNQKGTNQDADFRIDGDGAIGNSLSIGKPTSDLATSPARLEIYRDGSMGNGNGALSVKARTDGLGSSILATGMDLDPANVASQVRTIGGLGNANAAPMGYDSDHAVMGYAATGTLNPWGAIFGYGGTGFSTSTTYAAFAADGDRAGVFMGGNVGIGTITPEAIGALDIYKGTGKEQIDFSTGQFDYATEQAGLIVSQRHSGSASGNYGYVGPMIDLRLNDAADHENSVAQIIGMGDANGGSGYSGSLVFATAPGGGGLIGGSARRNAGQAPIARMIIDHNGFVGIGTDTPTERLHVVEPGTASTDAAIYAHASATGASAATALLANNASSSGTAKIFRGQQNGVDKFIMTNFGYMGITNNGTQPSYDLHIARADATSRPTILIDNQRNVVGSTPSKLAFLADRFCAKIEFGKDADPGIATPGLAFNSYINASSSSVGNGTGVTRMFIDAGTGNVGIGIPTPTARVEINNSPTDPTQRALTVTNLNTSALAHGLWVSTSSGSNANYVAEFHSAGTPRMVILGDGKVGIGTGAPQYPLDITVPGVPTVPGTITPAAGRRWFNTATAPTNVAAGNNVTVSVRALGAFWSDATAAGGGLAGGFYASSDQRIKNIHHVSNSQNDLAQLMKIEVTDYTLKDTLGATPSVIKGLIAQQVESVYPEAVSKQYNFIPNIYKLAKNVMFDSVNKTLTVTMDETSDLQVGDVVRLITPENENAKHTVVSINDNSFTVGNWNANTGKVFVFGKQVSDFRIVDYDRIHTLGVSAIQELAKRNDNLTQTVDELKAQLEAAQAELNQTKTELQQSKTETAKMSATVEDILKRLEKVENLTGSQADNR